MQRMVLCIAGAIASTGCHAQQQTSEAQAPTKQDGGEAGTAAAGVIQSGEYQYDSQTEEMKIPGMPADYGAKQIANEHSDQGTTFVRHCVSHEEALDPRLIFSLEDKACNFSHFAMANGKIDLQLVCRGSGVTETKVMTGTYTQTSFAVDVWSRISGGERSGAEMKMRVKAHRIGACSENGG